jgi:dTDP-4-dehydrorhamnose reductase
MSHVLLLGASGYLGRATAARLAERDPPLTLQSARSITEMAIEPAPDDTILNCAGYIGIDRNRLREANVEHVAQVAKVARSAGARVVHVSSSAVFDGIRSGELTETTTPRPRSAYGASKLEGERCVMRLLPEACLVRPAKLFGGPDPRRRLHSLVAHVVAGRPLPAPVRPQLWANFVWVRDAARVLADCVAEPPPETVVHLASPLPWTDFIELLGTAAGRPIRQYSGALEPALRVAVAVLEHLPFDPPPRRIERLVELWDRRIFRDSRNRLGPASLLEGLRDLVSQTGR